MKWDSRSAILVTGKAFTGKTYFIREHVGKMPPSREVWIYDFTAEYGDLLKKKNVHLWQVKRGTLDEVEDFTQRAYAKGNLTVIYSEADNYLAMNSPVLLAMVTTGRNRGINFIVDAKRPMSVKPAYRGRFNKLILFRTTLQDDIEYIEDWIGTGRGTMARLKELEQGYYIEVDLDNQEVSEPKKL
jgi:hypothetical protein